MGNRAFNPLIVVLLFVVLITFIIVNVRSDYFSHGKEDKVQDSKNEFSPVPLKLTRQFNAQGKFTPRTNTSDPAGMDLYSSLNLVRSDLSSGRTQDAENRLRDLLVFFPEDRAVLTMLSGLLYLTDRNNESKYLLIKLVTLYPEDIYARENLAFIYEKNKDYDKAIAEFIAITSMSNENVVSLVHLAGIYSIQNDRDKALAYFKAVYSKIGKNIISISLDPSFDNIRNTPEFILIIEEAKKQKSSSVLNVPHKMLIGDGISYH